jgi:hypothetical protein
MAVQAGAVHASVPLAPPACPQLDTQPGSAPVAVGGDEVRTAILAGATIRGSPRVSTTMRQATPPVRSTAIASVPT